MHEIIHGDATSLQCADGLCVAIVDAGDDIERIASRLAEEMGNQMAHTGILLVGSEYARSFFGSVRREWSERGIGMVVGASDDLAAEAKALFGEYDAGLAAVEASLRRLGDRARQRGRQAGLTEPGEPRVSETWKSEQREKPQLAPQGSVGMRPHVKQQSVMGSMSRMPQRAVAVGTDAASMAAGAIGGSVQGGRPQEGGAGAHASGGSSGASGGDIQGPVRRKGNI